MRRAGGTGSVARTTSLAVCLVATIVAACHSKRSPSAEADAAAPAPDGGAPDGALPDPSREDLWARAKVGEADDLARLADREGSLGLEERSKDAAVRVTALRAAGFTSDLEALPWLASVATSGTDDEALAALESAEQIAASPRRSVDPDDALEVRSGCDALLALAKGAEHPKVRRARAIGVLRMLSDRGCAPADAIPTDLDLR